MMRIWIRIGVTSLNKTGNGMVSERSMDTNREGQEWYNGTKDEQMESRERENGKR